MSEIIPSNTPPPDPNGGDSAARERGKTLVCECCGSKLDRHGNLLRRGELAKNMIESEDTIEKMKKSLAKAEEVNAALRQEIDALKAQVQPKRQSLWSKEA